jgi:hypothetical protein
LVINTIDPVNDMAGQDVHACKEQRAMGYGKEQIFDRPVGAAGTIICFWSAHRYRQQRPFSLKTAVAIAIGVAFTAISVGETISEYNRSSFLWFITMPSHASMVPSRR